MSQSAMKAVAAAMIRIAALVIVAALLAPAPVLADHGAPFRTDGMGALTSALLTGGLAFVVALIVVVVVVLLTRPRQPHK